MPVNYYQDQEKKRVRPDLFVSEAENWVSKFEKTRESKGVSKHQLRKFYNEVLVHKSRIISSGLDKDEAFQENLPFIRMLASKAFYAMKNKRVNEEFYGFIKQNVMGLECYRDFEVFVTLFEAVVAYGSKLSAN